ncbi:hypothetical protein ACF06L_15545 [Streptomyces sp. NPDC015408]|uniref:hypothetical protein n=1 Tax=Streptomyces sp. NPDC015408 TaxID=3364956 RepID=UPI0036F6B73D
MPDPENEPEPGGEGGGGAVEDPDKGKEFGHLVPGMSVGWEAPPSFNQDPSGGAGGESATEVADSGPIMFDATTVRATETTLLSQGRTAVGNYETLRARVDTAVHAQFWALAEPEPVISSGSYGPTTPGGTGWSPTVQETNDNDARIVAEIGQEFAAHINPAMQKALALQANALALLGNYIALINSSGQSYSRLDRASRFPEPPGPVTS